MSDEVIKRAWSRMPAGTVPLSREAIEAMLRPAARRTGRSLAILAWSYAALLGVTALLAAINLVGYRGNSAMLAVEGTLCGVAVLFGAYAVRIAAELRRIGRLDIPLAEKVEQSLRFYQRRVEPWLIMAAATPWMLSFAINSLIDNVQGRYPIHHPWEFAIVSVGMVVGMYIVLRVSLIPTVREMQALLHDLRAQVLDETPAMDELRKRSRAWMAVAVLLLTLSVVFGVLKWLGVV